MNSKQKTSSIQSEKALFLDRDGVIVDYVPYLSQPNQVQIPQKAGEALKKWQDAGYLLIVITNQSGVGRGYFSMDMVDLIHKHIRKEYSAFGVRFEEFFVCPHLPSIQCKCRKPSPSMLFQASQKYNIDIDRSFFVGDASSDIECAISAGCNPVLLLTGKGSSTSRMLCDNDRKLVSIFNSLSETIELIKN
ncbi:MAG: D-glycero-alpha-D-manno-heptose-1,7-bisphosphate 7-phosphatase [Pseudanabaena sp.]|jgi:D-glycero-D-manno-heptose 1,7-bisphosphate phosphatase